LQIQKVRISNAYQSSKFSQIPKNRTPKTKNFEPKQLKTVPDLHKQKPIATIVQLQLVRFEEKAR
jgi:hypothetical protein